MPLRQTTISSHFYHAKRLKSKIDELTPYQVQWLLTIKDRKYSKLASTNE